MRNFLIIFFSLILANCSLNNDSQYWRENSIENKTNQKKLNEILKSIKKRDKNDYNRRISPLKKTKDSILINTTKLSKKACFKKIKSIIDKKLVNGNI